jgi:ABC-type antimicrobial peptide transport system permease subunit
MTLRAFLTILGSQLRTKWGRFILSAGGIVVGIWAITMTTSISLGLSDTVITAINSQSFAREIQIFKTEDQAASFFELDGPPVFIPMSLESLEGLESSDDRIKSVIPAYTMLGYTNFRDSGSCVDLSNQIESLQASSVPTFAAETRVEPNFEESEQELPSDPGSAEALALELSEDCPDKFILADNFDRFYDNNKSNWVGSEIEPSETEIVVCFRCGNDEFNENFDGIDTPEELVGQTVTFEYFRAPELYPAGQPIDVTNFEQPDYQLDDSEQLQLTISAVIDDREANLFGPAAIYLNDFHFQEAAALAFDDYNKADYGVTDAVVITNDYLEVQPVSDELSDDGFLTFSVGLLLITGIQAAFTTLTVFLAGFGLIALIASVFGIVSVMTISVLERKKEIGILKSLGARNANIFWLFVFESGIIGIIGWIIGTLLSLGVGQVISFGFNWYIENNPDFADDLEVFNITDFSPDFPWWLLLGTLVLALFFTVIAGVFPALRASRQNPVEVLRSE